MASFNLTPREVVLHLDLPPSVGAGPVEASPDVMALLEDGREVGTLRDVILRCLSLPEIGPKVFESARKLLAECRTATLDIEPLVLVEGQPHSLFVEVTAEGPAVRVLRAVITADFRGRDEPLPFKHGKLGDVAVSWASGKLVDKDCTVLVARDSAGDPIIVLKSGADEKLGQLHLEQEDT
jgi:hypothetical protein